MACDGSQLAGLAGLSPKNCVPIGQTFVLAREAGPISATLGRFRPSTQHEVVKLGCFRPSMQREVVKLGRFRPSTQREVQVASLLTNHSQYS